MRHTALSQQLSLWLGIKKLKLWLYKLPSIKIIRPWDLTHCGLVNRYRRFWGSKHFPLQGLNDLPDFTTSRPQKTVIFIVTNIKTSIFAFLLKHVCLFLSLRPQFYDDQTMLPSWCSARFNPLGRLATSGLIVPVPDNKCVRSSWWNDNWQGNSKYLEKTWPRNYKSRTTWHGFEPPPPRCDVGE
jgi:hypothetical protein